MPCDVRPSPGASPKQSTLSPTWRGWDFRPGFVSGDYYPIIPFIFMYLAGYFAAHIAQGIDKTVPSWAYANSLPALASLGRYALPFYLLHQPIILGILESRLLGAITLEPRCDTSRQFRHNTNAILKIFLMQKGPLLMHECNERTFTIWNVG